VVKETVLKRKHKEREKKKQSFVKNVPSLWPETNFN
jgi:hypothetical protein